MPKEKTSHVHAKKEKPEHKKKKGSGRSKSKHEKRELNDSGSLSSDSDISKEKASHVLAEEEKHEHKKHKHKSGSGRSKKKHKKHEREASGSSSLDDDISTAKKEVDSIVRNAANIVASKEVFEDGQTRLHKLARNDDGFYTEEQQLKAIKALVDEGADVNAPDDNKQTPLHYAVRYSAPSAVLELFTDAGADLNALDNDKKTPRDYVVTYSDPSVVIKLFDEIIARKANATKQVDLIVKRADRIVKKVDSLVKEAKNIAVLKEVFEGGQTRLHCFARNHQRNYTEEQQLRAIEALAGAGADVNAPDDDKQTPLHYAVIYSAPPAVIKLFVEKGAELNGQDKNRCTPLFLALASRKTEYADQLLKLGADANIGDRYGFPWTMALETYKKAGLDSTQPVQSLVEYGLRIDGSMLPKLRPYILGETLHGIAMDQDKELIYYSTRGEKRLRNFINDRAASILFQGSFDPKKMVASASESGNSSGSEEEASLVPINSILPFEILCHITSFLSSRDLGRLLLTTRVVPPYSFSEQRSTLRILGELETFEKEKEKPDADADKWQTRITIEEREAPKGGIGK